MPKYSINSIKTETIYHKIDEFLCDNPDINDLLKRLNIHPFNDINTLPPEHFIPYKFDSNLPFEHTSLSHFIKSFDAYLTTLIRNISYFKLNLNYLDVYLDLTRFYNYYKNTLHTYYPKYFSKPF